MPFAKPIQRHINHADGQPVAVIATFKPSGEFVPLQFAIVDESEELHRYKVDAISSIKETFNIKSFTCKYTEGDRQHSVVLVYSVAEHRWFIR